DFNATISGKFNINDLPASFQGFLNRYYPTYVSPPKSIPQNQRFNFAVNTSYIEPYLPLLDMKISGFNDASITGSIDTYNNAMNLVANVPFGRFGNFSFANLALTGKGTRDTLSVAGTVGSIQATDSIRFPNTRLNIVSSNDHSEVSIRTSADNTLNDADLYADVYTLSDGIRVQFRPSSFVLNDKKWAIDKAGELVVRSRFVHAANIRFTQGFQEITAETAEEDASNSQNLIVKMKNVIMGDLTSLLFKNPRFEGVTSGNIVLNDFFGDFHASADLKAEQFRMDDDSIGLVNIKATYNAKTGEIPFTIQSPNEGYKFNAKGSYNAKDTTGLSLNTDLQLEDSKIDILHKFLSNLFTDIKGTATGNLNISGNINSPDLYGRVKLRNASMKVNYTQVSYTIDSADINFEKDGIDFGRFNIHDRYKNTGTVSGKLYEKDFRNMRFDFSLVSNKLLMLDTRSADNQQFYGKAIGRVNKLTLSGPEAACRLYIDAEANDSSHIFIPNSISRQSGSADFIVFKQYGTEMVKENSSSNLNMTVDLDLTVNNNVKIDVILDELSGDVIKAVGNGILKIRAGTTEPLSIRGRYNIDSGSYVLNYQGLIHRPFLLLPDVGNYIEWTGDPYRADVHIDAQYTAERVSLSELVGNNFFSPVVRGYRGDVYVIAQLRDKLNKPDIKFRLDFPQSSPVKSDNDFAQYLNRLERDQNEILNQVAYVILFNSFAPPGAGGGNAIVNPYSIGYNTLSQLLTKGINKVFSNLIYKLTGDRSLRFDVGTSIYSSASLLDPSNTNAASRIDRTRVDVKLTRAFANDKVIVTLGSDFDFNLGSSAIQNANTQWLPNVNIEFVLSRDRKLRLIVFNRGSFDLSGTSFGRRNRQGVSISYRKDFEKLFGKKEDDTEVKVPADSTTNKGQ
ncbi:MAG: translocation/assembly module TamB domain-containing protein, partial [Chitinophagaceae bacterium]|nr:translocation/assembly module TamB domain-containing protein [Chitinophagaceae bacterium]